MNLLRLNAIMMSVVALCLTTATMARGPIAIENAVEQWLDSNPNVTGVVVRWKNQVIYQSYRGRQKVDDLMPIYSITKSVGSLLTGIAIHRGDLTGVDTLIAQYFPDHADLISEEDLSVSLRHVLTMTSGLQWGWILEGRPIQSFRGDLDEAALSLPRSEPPGETAIYSTLIVNLIAGVLEKASGMDLEEYTESFLFAPLGIELWDWHRDDTDRATIGAGLRLRTLDMAMLGQLVLDRGQVNGKTLLKDSFINKATSPLVQLGLPDGESVGYGYLFWQSDKVDTPHFIAFGYAEQMIFGVFEHDLVIAVSAPCCAAQSGSSAKLVTDHILPVFEK